MSAEGIKLAEVSLRLVLLYAHEYNVDVSHFLTSRGELSPRYRDLFNHVFTKMMDAGKIAAGSAL